MLDIIKVNNNENLKDCLEIREKVFIEEKNVPVEIENDCYDKITEECDHFLIKLDNENVGTLRCYLKDENQVKLQRFCILREYRKLGIGKKVLSYIENYYKINKKAIIMDAKYEAVGFYEKCGYKKVSDVFIEADIEHITMLKNINV